MEKQEKDKTYKNKCKTIKKTVIRSYISTITLNVNRLNAPIKRHTLAEQMKTCACNEGNYKQGEKPAFRMKENNSKRSN